MKKDNLEENIKKAFENYRPEPPANLWAEIDSQLSEDKKATWGFLLAYAAAIAFLFVFLWGGYWFYLNTKTVDGTRSEMIAGLEDFETINPLEPITFSEQIKPANIKKQQSPAPAQKVAITADISSEKFTETKPNTAVDEKITSKIKPEKEHKPIINEYYKPDFAKIALVKDISLKIQQKKIFYYPELFDSETQAEETPDRSRWTFGIQAAPQYAYRINSSDPDILEHGKNVFEQNESYLFTYNIGFNVACEINDKFSIESGLQYVSMGQSIRNIQVYQDPNKKPPFEDYSASKHPQSLLTSMGEISFYDQTLYFEDNRSQRVTIIEGVKEPDSYMPSKGNRLDQNIDFLELPLILRYDVFNNNTKIQLKGGVGFNYMVSNNVVLKSNDSDKVIGATSLIRNWNMSVSGGTALIIPLNNKINFHIEPMAKIFLSSMTKGREYNVYPFGLSVYTGFSMPI